MASSMLSRRLFIATCAAASAVLGLGAGAAAFAADDSAKKDAAASGSASADASTKAASAAKDGMRTVVDMNGDEVQVAADASTILTANSVATQMVLMVGGEGAAATLGQGFKYDEGSLNRRIYPNLADVKTFKRDDVTVENVAVIDPDLVLIDVKDTVQTLRDNDIAAAYVAVNSPETIKGAITIIGDALGEQTVQKAADYVAYYDGVLADVAKAAEGLTAEEKRSVIYMSSATGTSGANSMADSWITTCGCTNVAAELGLSGARAEINIEAVLAADPDFIVTESADFRDELMADPACSELTAVKSGQVIASPFGVAVWSMGSADAPLMVQWAAATFNPDLYPDLDIDAETRDFYQKFYGYELTDEDLDAIFNRA